MRDYFKKFKSKWGIKSNFQLIIILVVFAITGSCSLFVTEPLLNLLNISEENLRPWLYRVLKIIIIFPIYNILIIIIGTIFGQFSFFWNFVKKMLSRIGLNFFKD
tara:strand:- start:3429 stop:3743 length:315 start_codon:yes stop_codon:yes gene_type:complete